MYSPKRKKGNIAEEIVVSHLKNSGFRVLDQNYLKKWGEIDIVTEKLRKIHFIEVKSSVLRNSDSFTDFEDIKSWEIVISEGSDSVSRETNESILNPVWNMTNKKKLRLSRITRTYLADKYDETMPEFQIDLVSVLLDFYQKIAYINRIENVLLETE